MKKIVASLALSVVLVPLGACSVPEEPVAPPATAEQTKAPKAKASKPEPKMTVAQENAVGSARSYLDTLAFSREGLIDQLKFEGFSVKDATFAVDYISPNWNEQAARSAKSYLDTMPFSRSGLIDQLEFEGFTHAQAVYGVNQTGL